MKHSILAIFAFLVLSTSVFAQTVVSMNYIDKYDTTLVTHSPIIFSGNSTTWGGALTIKAPSAGTLGQLFVSGGASADPGYLSGQGAAGDFLISAGGGANPTFSTIKQLSILGQDSVTTSTTPVPSGLSFVAAANSTYVVDGYLRDSAST